ncbi:hypothetical protein ACU686_13720 [Yinghuangia aomiensis]
MIPLVSDASAMIVASDREKGLTEAARHAPYAGGSPPQLTSVCHRSWYGGRPR